MPKIKVKKPIVEIDGDEMTRIIWQFIKDKLILPYLDIELNYYDLGIENRDATDDQITIDAANAIEQVRRRRQVRDDHAGRGARRGIRSQEDVEVAQRHDPQHPGRHRLPRADHLQQRAAPRAGLDAADRHRPPRVRRPVSRHRHESSRQGQADDAFRTGRRRRSRSSSRCSSSPSSGVAMAMYNLDESIRGFARACFNYALELGWPVYLSTKNTILKTYDGRFKDLFQEVFDKEFARQVQGEEDHLRASPDRRHGRAAPQMARRLRLGLQELRRRRAVRHGRAGLRLARPDDLGADDAGRQDRRGRGRARHRHAPLSRAPEGQADLDQPDRLDLRLDARSLLTAASSTARRTWCASPRRSRRSASRPSRPAR